MLTALRRRGGATREGRIGGERHILIGTRGSNLAMTQALGVMHALERAHPGVPFRLEVIRTRGDRDTGPGIRRIAGEGVFTRELGLALIEGRIDLAVHSLKDVPTQVTSGLSLASAVPPREDPRDVIVTRDGRAMALDRKSVV